MAEVVVSQNILADNSGRIVSIDCQLSFSKKKVFFYPKPFGFQPKPFGLKMSVLGCYV